MKRMGWFLVAAGVAIAAFVTLRRWRERAYEDDWESDLPAAVGFEAAMAEEPVDEAEPAGEEVVVEEVQVAVSEPAPADDEATFVTVTPLVSPTPAEEAPAAEEESAAEAEEEAASVDAVPEEPPAARDDDTMEGPSPITRLHTDRETAELRDQIAASRSRMRSKARGARGEKPAEPDAGEPDAG